MSTPIIAYFRVSTGKQGRSGLGLEAQRKAVAAYANQYDLLVADEFTEVETGRAATPWNGAPCSPKRSRRPRN
jgi:DNA invertase Pin-like site-specific DNA recombinase